MVSGRSRSQAEARQAKRIHLRMAKACNDDALRRFGERKQAMVLTIGNSKADDLRLVQRNPTLCAATERRGNTSIRDPALGELCKTQQDFAHGCAHARYAGQVGLRGEAIADAAPDHHLASIIHFTGLSRDRLYPTCGRLDGLIVHGTDVTVPATAVLAESSAGRWHRK